MGITNKFIVGNRSIVSSLKLGVYLLIFIISLSIVYAFDCGNGDCEVGETYVTCPQDCNYTLWLEPAGNELKLNTTVNSTTYTFNLSDIPVGFSYAILSLEARIDYSSFGGFTPAFNIRVNNTNHSNIKMKSDRLVNKLNAIKRWNGEISAYSTLSGWNAMFSADYISASEKTSGGILGGQAYEFSFDISSLLSNSSNNTVQIIKQISNYNMSFRNITITFTNLKPVQPIEEYSSVNGTPKDNFNVNFNFTVGSKNEMIVGINEDNYTINSFFSYPNKTSGYNHFGDTSASNYINESSWNVTTTVVSSNEYLVVGNGSYYRIERRIVLDGHHILINDTFINYKSDDVGIMNEHYFTINDTNISKIYFDGLYTPFQTGSKSLSGDNPSLFLLKNNSGIGMIALDDVFRAQMTSYNTKFKTHDGGINESKAGIKDSYFALKGNSNYTMEWAIYPEQKGADYYDFVNSVRNDWDVNFQINGSWFFFYSSQKDWTSATWTNKINAENVSYFSSAVPYNDSNSNVYATGSAFLNESKIWVNTTKNMIINITGSSRISKILIYLHSYISSETGALTKYADSLVINSSNGSTYSGGDTNYPFFYGNYSNTYGPQLYACIDKIIDDMNASGVYLDEFETPLEDFDYNASNWDGYTANINSTDNNILYRMNSITLLTRGFRVSMLDRIRQKNGTIVANSQPRTRTMTLEHFPRFTETSTRAVTELRRGHLFTPIGLGSQLVEEYDYDQDLYDSILGFLDYGSLYYPYVYHFYYPNNPIQQMYPITPKEIHAGYIIGEEKIITRVNGTFGWNDNSNMTIYFYNSSGALVSNSLTVTKDAANHNVTNVVLGAKEMVIINRITYCGDGTCGTNESCSTCELDCGICSPGGGGGDIVTPTNQTGNITGNVTGTTTTDKQTNVTTTLAVVGILVYIVSQLIYPRVDIPL